MHNKKFNEYNIEHSIRKFFDQFIKTHLSNFSPSPMHYSQGFCHSYWSKYMLTDILFFKDILNKDYIKDSTTNISTFKKLIESISLYIYSFNTVVNIIKANYSDKYLIFLKIDYLMEFNMGNMLFLQLANLEFFLFNNFNNSDYTSETEYMSDDFYTYWDLPTLSFKAQLLVISNIIQQTTYSITLFNSISTLNFYLLNYYSQTQNFNSIALLVFRINDFKNLKYICDTITSFPMRKSVDNNANLLFLMNGNNWNNTLHNCPVKLTLLAYFESLKAENLLPCIKITNVYINYLHYSANIKTLLHQSSVILDKYIAFLSNPYDFSRNYPTDYVKFSNKSCNSISVKSSSSFNKKIKKIRMKFQKKNTEKLNLEQIFCLNVNFIFKLEENYKQIIQISLYTTEWTIAKYCHQQYIKLEIHKRISASQDPYFTTPHITKYFKDSENSLSNIFILCTFDDKLKFLLNTVNNTDDFIPLFLGF